MSYILLLFLGSPKAYPSNTFYCTVRNSVFTTMVRINSKKIPFIYWRFEDSINNLTPEERCKIASDNLQAAQDNNMLDQISYGYIEDQPTICIVDKKSEECNEPIIMLSPGTDPKSVLLQMLDLRGIVDGEVIEQNSRGRVYVNISEYISNIPPD